MTRQHTTTYWLLLSVSLLLAGACSSQHDAPTDQLIEGPFEITTQWQTFPLKKPLGVIPYIIKFQILLDQEIHEIVGDIPTDPYRIMNDSYKQIEGSVALTPEVILITLS